MGFRVGVDIGGTFTDAIVADEETGEITVSKVHTTPKDLTRGVIEALEEALTKAGATPKEVIYIVHGTTIVTNAILQKRIARTAMICTKGFRDIIEIGKAVRYGNLYDLNIEKPPPIVPRHLRFTIDERINYKGKVLRKLNDDEVRKIARRLRQLNVEAVAICFLHSYINPLHEERVSEIISEEYPDVYLSTSSEICPKFREYERASTTVLNASVLPLVNRYLGTLESMVRKLGVPTELHLMQSNGGMMTATAARLKPVHIIESGPAGGVVAAAHIARMCGYHNVISLDIGGTTAKAGLIKDGVPSLTSEFEVGGSLHTRSFFGRGGYPLSVPVIDLSEVGTGGGSIAWIDEGGLLKVGPESAGADPGPACYGIGGSEPTVTDANLLLGRINSKYFLGGKMILDASAARRAVQEKIAMPLGMDVVDAAWGIVEVANSNMVRIMKTVTIERGYDPREFVLVAFGGAGPMHAARIAEDLGIPYVVIPEFPGITSALGFLVTDIKYDFVQTCIQKMNAVGLARVNDTYRKLESKGTARLRGDGFVKSQITLTRSADIRYVNQSYEVSVPVRGGILEPQDIVNMREAFHLLHEKIYGHSAREDPTEIVNLRVTAIGTIPPVRLRKSVRETKYVPEGASKGYRDVFFRGEMVSCPVFEREKLSSGNLIGGPAIIEQPDSTTVIPPGTTVEVDAFRNLIIKKG